MSEYNKLSEGHSQINYGRQQRALPMHDDHDYDSTSRSISSKFSRGSRKNDKNRQLSVPLTSCFKQQQEDESKVTKFEINGANDSSKFTMDEIGSFVGATVISNEQGDDRKSSYCHGYSNGADMLTLSPSLIQPSASNDANDNSNYCRMVQQDPFYTFRADLLKKLSLVEEELEKYFHQVRNTDTAANIHQIKETKKQLKHSIKHAESTLTDVETTVRVVERNRVKFPHISDDEATSRRNFVHESQGRLKRCKEEMQSTEIKDKLVRDERALIERRKETGAASTSPKNKFTRQNIDRDSYLDDRNISTRSETLLMMQQQDETLDDLDQAVTRVGYMAETIHEEINTQNKMLNSLEDDLVDAEEQLGAVMGKLAKLLKTKNKCQIGLILVLSLIVLVLFFLVIYT